VKECINTWYFLECVGFTLELANLHFKSVKPDSSFITYILFDEALDILLLPLHFSAPAIFSVRKIFMTFND